MKLPLFRSLGIASVAALFAMVAAAQAKPAPAVVLGGTVETLSPAARTLTIKSDSGAAVTLKVTRATVIRRNAAAAKLFRLAPGDRVVAGFNRATDNASRITAKGPLLTTVRGQAVKVDAAHQMLQVATGAGVVTIRTSAATRVVRNNHTAPLSAITLRDAVTVHTPVGAGSAAAASDVEADGPEEEEVGGTIAGISGGDVTITPADGSAAVTLHTDGNTKITKDEAPATLADLAAGMKVHAEFDPVALLAFSIEAESAEQENQEVEGQVSAVDASHGTVAIAPAGGGAMITLTVNANTRISVDDQPGTLADVKVGDAAKAELTAALVALQLEVTSGAPRQEDQEVEGQVSAVDASHGTVSITPAEGGAMVTLTVDANTRISVDDQPGTLADVKVGAAAKAELTAALVAVELEVQDSEGHD